MITTAIVSVVLACGRVIEHQYRVPEERERLTRVLHEEFPFGLFNELKAMDSGSRDLRIRALLKAFDENPDPARAGQSYAMDSLLALASPPLQKEMLQTTLVHYPKRLETASWETTYFNANSTYDGEIIGQLRMRVKELSLVLAKEAEAGLAEGNTARFQSRIEMLMRLPLKDWDPAAWSIHQSLIPTILEMSRSPRSTRLSLEAYLRTAGLGENPEKDLVTTYFTLRNETQETDNYFWMSVSTFRGNAGLPELDAGALHRELVSLPIPDSRPLAQRERIRCVQNLELRTYAHRTPEYLSLLNAVDSNANWDIVGLFAQEADLFQLPNASAREQWLRLARRLADSPVPEFKSTSPVPEIYGPSMKGALRMLGRTDIDWKSGEGAAIVQGFQSWMPTLKEAHDKYIALFVTQPRLRPDLFQAGSYQPRDMNEVWLEDFYKLKASLAK